MNKRLIYQAGRLLCLSMLCLICHLGYAQVHNSTEINEMFSKPYIDIDEWRDKPTKHRYVHGGFEGTDTRFSFYFPPKEQYEGRFFQFITPLPDSENLAQMIAQYMPDSDMNMINSTLSIGSYLIETNGGGFQNMGTLICAYQANSASAEFSRKVASEMYGAHRTYGYATGGSGGAYRTIGGLENTKTWDGVIPLVVGSPMALPNVFCVRMHAMRILKDKFPQIVEAMEPGGSGDMYAGLNAEEAAALREVTKMGFPVNSWYAHKTMGVHGFAAIYSGIVGMDGNYFDDFWTKEGYMGADKNSSIHKAHLKQTSRIKSGIGMDEAIQSNLIQPMLEHERGSIDAAWKSLGLQNKAMPIAFQIEDNLPDVGFMGGEMIIITGDAAGQMVQLSKAEGNKVVYSTQDLATISKIKAGDEVLIDNSKFLAAQTYHRHQVPGKEYHVWDQFRDANGNPIYPQRPMLIGPIFTQAASGIVPTGKYDGKMIVICGTYDREAFPWQGDWYRELIKSQLGDKTDNQFRLYYIDRTTHAGMDDPLRTVGYGGATFQALLDLINWVEKGIAPPATTGYVVNDGQVVLAANAKERKGIQPLVSLTVNGKKSLEVPVGKKVELTAITQLPPRTGQVVSIEWNMEGGDFTEHNGKPSTKVSTTYTFTKPGVYYPAVRVASQREESLGSKYSKVQNLDRVRVVVK